MDGWKMSFLLGPGLFKGAMLVLGRVSWRNKSNKKENQGLGMEKTHTSEDSCWDVVEVGGGVVFSHVQLCLGKFQGEWYGKLMSLEKSLTLHVCDTQKFQTHLNLEQKHSRSSTVRTWKMMFWKMLFLFQGLSSKLGLEISGFCAKFPVFFFPIRWAPVIRYKWSYSYNSYRLGL